MRPPPSHLTTEHRRAGGRKRAQQFTTDYQSDAGKKGAAVRTQQASFHAHMLAIAPDGPAKQRAELRAPKGSRLLKPEDVHFLRLENISGDLGETWPEEKRRILLGRYIWAYLWSGIEEPPRPTKQEFFALVEQARERVGCGLPLLNPLHVIGVAANDFCNAEGRLYGWRNQRRLFRQALREARSYACLLQNINDYFTFALIRREVDNYFAALAQAAAPRRCVEISHEPPPRVLGRRRPMNTGGPYIPAIRPPRLPIHWRPIYWQLGRRPYARTVQHAHACSASMPEQARTPGYWLPPATDAGDEPDR